MVDSEKGHYMRFFSRFLTIIEFIVCYNLFCDQYCWYTQFRTPQKGSWWSHRVLCWTDIDSFLRWWQPFWFYWGPRTRQLAFSSLLPSNASWNSFHLNQIISTSKMPTPRDSEDYGSYSPLIELSYVKITVIPIDIWTPNI